MRGAPTWLLLLRFSVPTSASSAASLLSPLFLYVQEESLFKDNTNTNEASAPVLFKANHPFVFVILDKDTGVICFMGVVADPKEMLEVVNEKDLSREEIHKLLVEEDDESSQDLESGSSAEPD